VSLSRVGPAQIVFCAICQAPALKASIQQDLYTGETRVVVRCHGGLDDFTIPPGQSEVDMRGIVAFRAQNEGLKLMREDRDW